VAARNGRGVTREDLRNAIEDIGTNITQRFDDLDKRLEERDRHIHERFESLDEDLKEVQKTNRMFDAGAAGLGGILAYVAHKLGL
jgi:hypothetical protein